EQALRKSLDTFRIEIPSWGFANTGTRFGKFIQPGAATSSEEKFSDAGQVHHFTGICPSVAVHVLWDFPEGLKSTSEGICGEIWGGGWRHQSQCFSGSDLQVRVFSKSRSRHTPSSLAAYFGLR